MLQLDPGRREIRLVQLLPGQDLQAIECKLFRASRDENPSYVVLSYTWGDWRQVETITVNGLESLVTSNLYEALLHIRNPNTPTTLWVDALCIDQKNNDERSWHVQQMPKTFGEAPEVYAWLGASSDAKDAMDML